MIRKLFLIFVCMLLFCECASAATVYVSTLGTDEYTTDGTNDHVEINQALAYAAANPGTTVYLRGPNTYWIDETLTVPSDTVFTGDSTAEVKLINSAAWARYIGLVEPYGREGNNITICNFSIDGNIDNQTENAGQDYYTVLRMDNTTNLTVHDMNLHNSKNDGVRVHLQTFTEGVGDINIYNNTINTCSHDGVYLWKVSGANIYNNDILPSTNSGIRTDGCNHLRIYDNYVHVPTYTAGAGIYVLLGSTIMKANDIEIYNNTVEHTNLAGIYLAAYNQYTLADASSVQINHNIVKDCGKHVQGEGYTAYNWGGGISIQGFNNTTVENNVIDGCYRNGVYLQDSYVTTRGSTTVNYKFNTILRNNIIINTLAHPSYAGSGYGIETLDSTNYTAEILYNDVWNNTAGGYDNVTAGANDISSDPLFVNTSANDYHLKSTEGYWGGVSWLVALVNSPCIDAGDPSSDYSNEPENNGNRINLGAYGNTVYASKTAFVPVCDFSSNVTSGTLNLTVQFNDTSTGHPTSWAWDFNEDTVTDSTDQNPVYTYTSAGVYNVTLTATNDLGSDSESKIDYIEALGTPQTVAEWFWYLISFRWW